MTDISGGSAADHAAVRAMQDVSKDIRVRIETALNPPPEPGQLEAATPTAENLAANLIAVGEHLITVADTMAAEITARAGIDPTSTLAVGVPQNRAPVMPDAIRLICMRLVPPDLDGVWMSVDLASNPPFSVVMGYTETRLVATGSVEWDNGQSAEVYVPEGRLAEWRAEHAVG